MENKIVVGQRIIELWAAIKSRFVQTVNGMRPDESGNVTLGVAYTPQKGVDYWTEEDIAEIRAYVDEAILGGEW